MLLNNNTIFITGGSSGIGLELIRRLIANNKIITCGRNEDKLKRLKLHFPAIDYQVADLSIREESVNLAKWVATEYPECNVLINNAALHFVDDFRTMENAEEKAAQVFNTNVLAPITLSKILLPVLENNNSPQLINISSGLAFMPKTTYPFYNASKAALHSFTQTIRYQLNENPVKVTEVFFPAVATPWHGNSMPKIAIPVEKAVDIMLKGLGKGKEEILVAGSKALYILSRIAPKFALKKINSLAHITHPGQETKPR